LELTFFGLTPEYRLNVFSQIHEIVFHGKGGYTWHDVYNMPIWLRRFSFQKIQEFYEKQNEDNNNQETPDSKKTFGPNISTSYSTKASR
jgi:hypothetical protein